MFSGEGIALCGGNLLSGEKVPMHNVRNGMGYSPEAPWPPGLCCSNHVNAWIPFRPFAQDPLIVMRTQVGAVVFDDSAGYVDGNYTHCVLDSSDVFVGATLRVGEFLVFCPLPVPHATAVAPNEALRQVPSPLATCTGFQAGIDRIGSVPSVQLVPLSF